MTCAQNHGQAPDHDIPVALMETSTMRIVLLAATAVALMSAPAFAVYTP